MARAGYALESGTGRAGRSRTRRRGGPRWSSRSRGASTARSRSMSSRSASTGTGRRSPRSTSAARRRDPAITFLDTRATAEADELAAATGIRGWALGPLPAALWLERHEPEAAATDPLVPHDLGVAGLPADRRRRRADRARPGHPRPGPSWRRRPACTSTAGRRSVAMGAVVGDAEPASPPRRSVSAPASRSPAGPTTPSRATSVPGLAQAGDAYDPGGSAGGFGVYWHEPVEVPGAFVTPAPLDGPVQRRCRDGGDRPGARLVPRRAWWAAASRPSDCSRRRPPTPPGADGVVFLPYLAGERSPIWDPGATGAFVGLTLGHGRAHLAPRRSSRRARSPSGTWPSRCSPPASR